MLAYGNNGWVERRETVEHLFKLLLSKTAKSCLVLLHNYMNRSFLFASICYIIPVAMIDNYEKIAMAIQIHMNFRY